MNTQTNFLHSLLSIESDANHPDQLMAVIDLVENYFKGKGILTKRYLQNGKPSLVVARELKKHYTYILNGHLDVVPATYPKAFEPYEQEGKLFTRGASDMKGPVYGLIEGFLASPEADAALMLTTDEEVGGFNGVGYLLQQEGYRADVAIIPDGGDNWGLVLGEKGIFHFEVTTKGKSAHGSRPWEGVNAIEQLMEIYLVLKKEVESGFKSIASPQSSQRSPMSADGRLEDKIQNWHPTLNLGVIQGGKATNVIPDQASMKLDFRYPYPEQREHLLQLLQKITQDFPGSSYQVMAEGQPVVNDPNSIYHQKLKQIAEKYERPLKPVHLYGASDGRFFSACNIPVIAFKPSCSAIHIDDEWIDLKELEIFTEIVQEFITK